jgi:hypothetical protein
MKRPVKITLGVLLGLPVLLVLLGVIITRDGFLRSVVLPRAGDALEADLSASSIRLNPFSSLEIRDFSLRKHDESLDVSLARLRLDFSLRRILGGQIGFDLLDITDPVIHTRPAPDAELPADQTPAVPAESPDLHLTIGEIRIQNGTFLLTTPDQTVTLEKISFTLRNLITDLPAALDFSTEALIDLHEQGRLETHTTLQAEFTLGSNLIPKTILAELETVISRAEGAFSEISDLSRLTLQVDAIPDRINKANFTAESAAGESLGRLELSGPFDPAAVHADLTLSVREIGPALLNLVGAPAGLQFGGTLITADARVQLGNGGNLLNATAYLHGQNVQVNTPEFTSPPVNLEFRTDLNVDLSAQTAHLRELHGTVQNQQQEELIQLHLEAPTRVKWDEDPPRFDDVALSLVLDNLRVADWKAFLPPELTDGRLAGRVDVGVARQGLDLQLTANIQAEDLGLTTDDLTIDALSITLNTRAGLAELKTLQIESLDLQATHRNQPLAQLQSQGSVETGTGEIRLNSQFRANPVTLLALLPEPPPDLILRDAMLSGTLELHQPSFDALPALTPALTLLIREGTLQETSLNGLRVRLNADVAPEADAFDLSLQLALDSVQTPGVEPISPLVPPFNLKGSLLASPEKVDIREFALFWTETPEADNRLNLTGSVNFADPEALVFDLALTGNRLDLSPWLPQSEPAEAEAPTVADAPGAETEPDPITLPVQDGTLRVNIASILLHGLQMDALEIVTQIAPNGVDLNTFQIKIAETPLTASAAVDLSVPGFKYQTRARLAPLPLAPVIQALAPEHADTFFGILEADFALAGAGITGPSLRKNLDGHMNMRLRDSEVNIRSLADVENPILSTFANVLLNLYRAVGPALGISGSELIDANLADVRFESRVGNGQIHLDTFRAGSPLIRVQSSGRIDMTDDLEASQIRNIPVQIALQQDLARRARLFREDRLQDGLIALPPFVQIRGTLGEPDIEVRRSVIAGLIAGGVTEGGLIRSERADRILGGAAGILTGEGPRPTPTPEPEATPAPTPESTPEPQAAPTPQPTPTPRPSGRTDRVLRGLDRILGPEEPQQP